MVIGCLCIILAILIGFVVVPNVSEFSATNIIDIVVLKEDVSKGTKITKDMLTTKSFKKDTLPDKYFENIDEVADKYANIDMLEDDIVTELKITDEATADTDTSYLQDIARGHVALAVSFTNYQETVGSRVEQGDVVTIFGEDGAVDPDLIYVKVLAVQDEDTKNIVVEEGKEENTISLVTFDLNIAQAEKVTKLAKTSNVYLGLAAKGGTEVATKLLEDQNSHFSSPTQGILSNWYGTSQSTSTETTTAQAQ